MNYFKFDTSLSSVVRSASTVFNLSVVALDGNVDLIHSKKL